MYVPLSRTILTELEGVSQNLRIVNGRFKTTFGHFFVNYRNIFHKTEVQTFILRCYKKDLYLSWFKWYGKNEKHAKTEKTQKESVEGRNFQRNGVR